MTFSEKRRNLLKAAATAPLLLSGGLISFPASGSAGVATQKPGYRLKLSLNCYSFNNPLRAGTIDLFDVLDFCAENNFDAIDPTGYYFPGYPEIPDDDYISRFKTRAFRLGLDISGTGVRNDFTQTDPEKRKADIVLVKKWVEVSAKLGAPTLRIFAGVTNHEGFTRDQVFEWMAKDVRECVEYGKKFGVVVAIQNHNDFLKTASDVHRIFKLINNDYMGLNLDIGSYRQGDPYQEISETMKYAVTWQIKENIWINGKEQKTDYSKLFSIIKNGGYRGYIPLETLGEGDPYLKVPRMLAEVREALSEN